MALRVDDMLGAPEAVRLPLCIHLPHALIVSIFHLDAPYIWQRRPG
eukprot:COSAG01_NODE_2747_length_7149_cov_5.321844_6_plen_46_part_00